jgi:ribosomal protein L13E
LSQSSRTKKGKAKKAPGAKKKGVTEEVVEEVKKVEKAVVKDTRKLERAVEGKAKPRAAHPRPSGRVPVAMVNARHRTGTITRPGKGFSMGELSQGGLAPRLAATWGVKVDVRRRSVLDGNVGALKSWHAKGTTAAVEREAKAAEEELKEVGEEAEREVKIAAEEVVKAGKAVKKEAKKAEKAVKRKVVKPKAQPKKKS